MGKTPKDIRVKGRFFFLHNTYSSLVPTTVAKVDLRDKGYYVRVRKIKGGYAVYKTKDVSHRR